MTLYGWDASHYDGTIDLATMRRAKAEGIAFFTHKIGEGTGGADGYDGTALAAARDAGIEFVGGYWVVRSGPVGPQVDELIALADRDEPWWRSYPGWFWQVDLERWSYDNVPAATGIALGQELRQRTGRTVVMYASHGQYGDQLAGWDGPLWNADYTSHVPAGFVAMYPGDNWAPLHGTWRGGWTPYSGQAPTFLQYTSSATIAGLTTCDANAFRGTVEQLRALITGAPVPPMEDEMKPIWYVRLADGRIARDDGTLYVVVGKNDQDRAWLNDAYLHIGRWGESSPNACDGPWKMDVRNPGLNPIAEPYMKLIDGTPHREYPPAGSVDQAALEAAAAKGAREGIDGATIHAA